MIRSFKNKLTASIDDGSVKKGFPSDMLRRAQQLLTILDAANTVEDLRSPPGNRLEKLSGDREGQYRSGSTSSGASASSGRKQGRKTWK